MRCTPDKQDSRRANLCKGPSGIVLARQRVIGLGAWGNVHMLGILHHEGHMAVGSAHQGGAEETLGGRPGILEHGEAVAGQCRGQHQRHCLAARLPLELSEPTAVLVHGIVGLKREIDPRTKEPRIQIGQIGHVALEDELGNLFVGWGMKCEGSACQVLLSMQIPPGEGSLVEPAVEFLSKG
jgi:hypothetical protein